MKPGEHNLRAKGIRRELCPPHKPHCTLCWVPSFISHASSSSQATRNAAGTTRRSSPMGCRLRLVDPNARPLLRGSRPRRMDPLEVREGSGWNPVRKDGSGINLFSFPKDSIRRGVGSKEAQCRRFSTRSLQLCSVNGVLDKRIPYSHLDSF